jgi:hypothetical protein
MMGGSEEGMGEEADGEMLRDQWRAIVCRATV